MRQFLFLLSIFLPMHFLNAQDTINVPGDYSTIQAAINVAKNGDLVLVADGTYYENINYIGKAITVASHFIKDEKNSHITNTIIDGSLPSNPDSGSVVSFVNGEDTTSVLCGFTIRKGKGTKFLPADVRAGGGIILFNSSAKICHNIIDSNKIDNSVIYAWCCGGGVAAAYSSNLIITNNIISENLIENNVVVGGGIALYFTGSASVTENEIVNNKISGSNGSGGGMDIWSPSSEIYVANNIIRGNQSLPNIHGGGGIDIYRSNSSVFIINNLIADNVGYQGGGIYVDNTEGEDFKKMKSFELSNQILNENAISKDRTLFSNKILLEAVIENNTIVDNMASIGGGISCSSSSPEIINSIIWGNQPQPQIVGGGSVEYSDVEGGYPGPGNIDSLPLFLSSEYYLLDSTSPCIDAGNPDPMYFDVGAGGNPLPPAQGSLINDMGHCGGPKSCWCFWHWPLPVELTSFTASVQFGKVNLHWTTSTETSNLGFEIERRILDDQFSAEWVTIGFREGHGSTAEKQEYFYIDDISTISATSFSYRLKQIDFDGSYSYSDELFVENQSSVNFALHQNFPNPFNPSTKIQYSVPKLSKVIIKIYDILGNEIETLVNEEKPAGSYELTWNAANLPSRQGSALPSGVYFYQLKAGSFVQTKKMSLLK